VQVEQVDFLSIPTRDVARAVAFYRDVLGLRQSEYSEGEVETPNVTLGFWNPERDGEEFRPTVAGLALRVADVPAACEEFVAGGGELVGIDDTGVCLMGVCKDLDGNTVILHRRYAPRVHRGTA
jgi:catechol 2,3-dioxygenase-like lactoylglutathione lyase family enzyme